MSDIGLLAGHFVTKFSEEHDKKITISPAAVKRLMEYSWGENNVRELEQVVRRGCMIAASKGVLEPDDLKMLSPDEGPYLSTPLHDPYPGFVLKDFIERVRVHYYRRALELAGGNQSEAARLLDLKPQAFNKFVKKHSECFNLG